MIRQFSLGKFSLGLAALALSFGFGTSANAQDATGAIVGGVGVKPLITVKIEDTKLDTAHKPFVPELKTAKDLGSLDPSTAMYLELGLRRSPGQEHAVQLLVQRSMNPTDAYYGKTLTPIEAAKTFGLAASDLSTVKNWLENKGFTVDTVDNGRLSIGFHGTADQVQATFHTELHSFEAKDGTTHFAPVSDLQFPKAIAPVFGHIEGLSNFAPIEHQAFSGPVTDFLPGTRTAAVPASVEDKSAETVLSGGGLHDASFTLSSYSLTFGKGSFTANVRLNGVSYSPTGSLTFVDSIRGTIARVADVSKCEAYGTFGRSCTLSVTPSKPGIYLVTAEYSGDEHTRAENLHIIANVSGTSLSNVSSTGVTTAPIVTLYTTSASATDTTSISYLGNAANPTAAAPTGTITIIYYNTTKVWAALTLGTTSGSGTSGNGNPYTYSCPAANTVSQTVTCTVTMAAAESDVVTQAIYDGFNLTSTYSGDSNYASSFGYAFLYSQRHASTVASTLSNTAAGTSTYGTAGSVAETLSLSAPTTGGNACGSTTYPAYIDYHSVASTAGAVAMPYQFGNLILAINGDCSTSGANYVAAGTVTLASPAWLSPGTYTIASDYTGNAGSTSTTLITSPVGGTGTNTLTVGMFTPTLGAITSSPTSAVVGSSTAATLTGTFVVPATGVLPSGAVTYKLNGVSYTANCVYTSTAGTLSCSATVPGATVAALSAGSYTISSTFAGDNYYVAVTTGGTGTFTVASDALSVSTSPTTEAYGANGTTTITAVLTSNATVTGTITLTAADSVSPYVSAIATINLTACTVGTSGSNKTYTCTYAWTPPATATGDSAGTITVTAAYSGSGTSTSATTTYTVTKATTALSVSASPTYVNSGAVNTTLTAVLSWSGVGLTPTGTISFACVPGTNTCSASPATLTINATNCPGYTTTSSSPITCTEAYDAYDNSGSYGTVTVTGTYGGDINYGTSSGTSNAIDVTENVASTTVISVTSGSPEAYGTAGSVVFSVVITGKNGDGAPTGTLVLTNSTLGTLATVTLSGTACTATNTYTYTCPVSYTVPAATAIGSYTVTATYNPTSIYYNGSSGTTSFSVGKQTPTFGTMSFSPASSVQYGTSLQITITDPLSYIGPTAPTGAVTFVLNGINYLATCSGTSSPLSCSASVPASTIQSLPAASYTVTVSYTADTDYAAATGTSGTFTVTQNTSTAMSPVTISPSTTIYPNGTATVSATLSYSGSGAAPGSGNALIVFSANNNALAQPSATFSMESCTYATNTVTCTAVLTPAATDTVATQYTVTATYAATTNYAGASNTGNFTYAASSVSLSTPTSTNNPSYYNQATTFSTTRTYVGTTAPTSPVYIVIYQGGSVVKTLGTACTGTLTQTCTTAPYALLPAGSYNVYAYEAADSTNGYATYTSAALTQTVNKQTPSSVTVSASPASVAYNGTETFSSTVTYVSIADGALAPTGTVSFYIDGSTTAAASCTLATATNTTSTCSATYTAILTTGSHTVTSTYVGDTNYFSNSGTGGSFTETPITQTLTLSGSANGTSTTGTTSDTITATLSPARSGVSVTITNAANGTTYTANTNTNGQISETVTSVDGVTPAGYNPYTATTAATNGYTAATSATLPVYVQGVLVSLDLKHNFSTDPGTTDGTKAGPYAITVTNFSTSSNFFNLSFMNATSNAFSFTTNCPATLVANQQCTVNFYYLPPLGDGNNTASSSACTSSPSTCGLYEQGTWTANTGTSGNTINLGVGLCSANSASGGVTTCTGGISTSRDGATAFPAVLAGKALLPANAPLSVTPQALNFGTLAIGAQSASQNITVMNTGSSSLSLGFNAPTDNAYTFRNLCPSSLGAGDSCQISVAFDSANGGTYNDFYTITPGGQSADAISVSLSGTASNPSGITLSSDSHNFGTVATGTTNSFNVTVTNSSSSAATVSFSNTAGSGYTFSNTCPASIAASATCTVGVIWSPTAAGTSNDTIAITSSVPILPGGNGTSAPYTGSITVTGTATANALFTISTYSHNFGTVTTGSAASNYGVTLTNTTGSPLTVTLGGFSNAPADGFSTVSNACGVTPFTLPTNGSCNITFGFTPTATGFVSDSRSISATNTSGAVTLYWAGDDMTAVTAVLLRGSGQ